MVKAAGSKPVWMTLQVAWSGVVPSEQHPENVPRFPTLGQERFMAYQAIVNGARGLAFFGGHPTRRRPGQLELDILGARASAAVRSCSSTCKTRSGPCPSPGTAFATGSRQHDARGYRFRR